MESEKRLPPPIPQRFAVIGGGITGLAAAHRLHELHPAARVTLFEASDRLGGVIHTESHGEFLFEHSADMFTTKDPWALDLCRRIGFEGELIGTNPAQRQSYVVHRGRLCPVPAGFTLMAPVRIGPILRTPILSWRGKLRLACEPFIARKTDDGDESLASFVTRRLGREAFERLVQPLIGGIYTADPDKLSMAATMPQFVAMEREYGSLLRGMRRRKSSSDEAQASGARYGLFVTPRRGLSSLIAALAARLPAGTVRLNTPVSRLVPNEDRSWTLTARTRHAAGEETPYDDRFDAVILAAPASCSAALLQPIASELSAELLKIPHASVAIVVAAYRAEQIARPLNGFGFVVPRIAGRNILAGSASSIKFTGRAPDGSVLFRIFVGGACQGELVQLPDDELRDLVAAELADLLGVRGEPRLFKIIRWPETMPQYHVGHVDAVKRIEALAARLPNFALAGKAYRGVGIPFCVRSGEQAAATFSPFFLGDSGSRLGVDNRLIRP